MKMPLLIYCAGGGGRRYAAIAIEAGFHYGSRSDHKPHYPCTFVDINWRQPDLDRHLAFVAEQRPKLAVAPDVLDTAVLPETLRYAERLAQHAERVVIVPKAPGVMAQLPHETWIVIGYSVPSRYGGADSILLPELQMWPVHLLGGSPMAQLNLTFYVDVFSADGNGHQRAARYGTWFDAERMQWATRDPRVPAGPDLPYRAFEMSCKNIMVAWKKLVGGDV